MLNCRVEWLWLVSPSGDGHVQQCLGLRAARTSLESVWSAGRRRGCRQQRRWETHTKNYSPVTIFHFFDVLSSMRMWVCYLMQSCLLPPPVVLPSLLIHVFFLYILKIYLYFFPVRCGGVCQSHAGDQRRLQREERGRWGHESGLELTPPTSLNWVPVKICDSFHFSISLDLLFSVMLS